MFRVNETRIGENGRKRHVEISKVEFHHFHQYSSSCEEYFGGEKFNFEAFLSTFPIQKNY